MFKVGDWLRPNKRSPVKLTIIDIDNIRLLENSVLWEPIEGEICWTYTQYDEGYTKDCFPILVKRVDNGKVEYIRNGRVSYTDIKDCVPFLGELPTFPER